MTAEEARLLEGVEVRKVKSTWRALCRQTGACAHAKTKKEAIQQVLANRAELLGLRAMRARLGL